VGQRPTVYEVLIGSATAAEALCDTCIAGLDVLPANADLAAAEIELASLDGRESRLSAAVSAIHEGYEFLVIDCPPSLGMLTLNALSAADAVVVPLQCEFYALEGLSALLGTVERIRGAYNPALALAGILLTMFDPRTSLSHQVAAEVRQHFPADVFATVVHRNVRLSESPSHGLPVLLYDGASHGAQAYKRLAEELIARTIARALKARTDHGGVHEKAGLG
jgi:chromosome partitioning protein